MIILGIESSCDETAAAVVKDGVKILSNVVATSSEMHAKTGGIIPEQAARQQVKSIIPVIQKALRDASINKKKIDAIAITTGPGLIGSLLVGVETAKTLSSIWGKPIIPVNHLVAHIYANWLGDKQPELPALALVVSGGHTDLVLMKNHGDLKWIGGTRDDAAGEAFDKTARLFGLPYPGGPAISEEASKYLGGEHNKQKALKIFPRPMLEEDNFDWSFSGLKTAVLREVENKKILDTQRLAAEVQEAIVDSLVAKCMRAMEEYKPKSFLLAGGVAANLRLREKLATKIEEFLYNVSFHVPPIKYCTDNASYIAAFAYYNNHSVHWDEVDANPQLTIAGES